jgi:Holliday junction resolvase-like predicted endonuclease
MRMVVTVKDRRGLLIRGAKISVRSTKAGRLSKRPKMHLSGRQGRATFTLRLRKTAFGKRLIVVTLAKTPKAKATKRSAVAVPRAKASR